MQHMTNRVRKRQDAWRKINKLKQFFCYSVVPWRGAMRDFTVDNLTDIVLQECESKATDPESRPIAGAKLDV